MERSFTFKGLLLDCLIQNELFWALNLKLFLQLLVEYKINGFEIEYLKTNKNQIILQIFKFKVYLMNNTYQF